MVTDDTNLEKHSGEHVFLFPVKSLSQMTQVHATILGALSFLIPLGLGPVRILVQSFRAFVYVPEQDDEQNLFFLDSYASALPQFMQRAGFCVYSSNFFAFVKILRCMVPQLREQYFPRVLGLGSKGLPQDGF